MKQDNDHNYTELLKTNPIPEISEIVEALESVDGYIAPAATILEISATRLHDKIASNEELKFLVKDFRGEKLKHQPKKTKTSERKEEALQAAVMFNCKPASVCKYMNLSQSALANWLARDDDFKKRWDEIYELVGDKLESILENKAINDADTRSAYTILRARYPQRGYRPEQKQEVNVNIGHEELLNAIKENKS